MASAMAMAAASTPCLMPASHLGPPRTHGQPTSMVHLRRTPPAAAKPMLWTGAGAGAGAGASRHRSSVVVAATAGGEDEESKEIKIGGEEEDEPQVAGILIEGQPEVAGILGEGEEVAALLEPPVDSIDEEYVEALNEGTLPDAGSEEEEQQDDDDLEDLKQQLIDSLYGTQRGLRASSDTRAEVVELISQLEAKNPTPAPTEAFSLLDGKWILAYTSYSELYPLLAAGNLPLVTVGEITQTIDAQALTLDNTVSFEGPLATTSFSASASFEIRSPKRVQVKFEEGVIGAPKVAASMDVPSSLDIFGQKIDLTPARAILQPLQEIGSRVARVLSGAPPFKFSIQTDRAQSWLLTTFLDEDIRISRGDGGSVFVLLREGSSLLY